MKFELRWWIVEEEMMKFVLQKNLVIQDSAILIVVF